MQSDSHVHKPQTKRTNGILFGPQAYQESPRSAKAGTMPPSNMHTLHHARNHPPPHRRHDLTHPCSLRSAAERRGLHSHHSLAYVPPSHPRTPCSSQSRRPPPPLHPQHALPLQLAYAAAVSPCSATVSLRDWFRVTPPLQQRPLPPSSLPAQAPPPLHLCTSCSLRGLELVAADVACLPDQVQLDVATLRVLRSRRKARGGGKRQ